MNISEQRIDPIAIGGMGGSGTRLVAEIVRELAISMPPVIIYGLRFFLSETKY